MKLSTGLLHEAFNWTNAWSFQLDYHMTTVLSHEAFNCIITWSSQLYYHMKPSTGLLHEAFNWTIAWSFQLDYCMKLLTGRTIAWSFQMDYCVKLSNGLSHEAFNWTIGSSFQLDYPMKLWTGLSLSHEALNCTIEWSFQLSLLWAAFNRSQLFSSDAGFKALSPQIFQLIQRTRIHTKQLCHHKINHYPYTVGTPLWTDQWCCGHNQKANKRVLWLEIARPFTHPHPSHSPKSSNTLHTPALQITSNTLNVCQLLHSKNDLLSNQGAHSYFMLAGSTLPRPWQMVHSYFMLAGSTLPRWRWCDLSLKLLCLDNDDVILV